MGVGATELKTMKTKDEVNREYTEAIAPAREKYATDSRTVEDAYNAELVAIKERFQDKLFEAAGKTVAAEDNFGRARKTERPESREVVNSMYALDDAEDAATAIKDEMRREVSEAEARRQKALAPVKAEYGRATKDAQRKRWEGLSHAKA